MRRTIMAMLATAVGTTLLVAAKALGAPAGTEPVAQSESGTVAPGASPIAPTAPVPNGSTSLGPASPGPSAAGSLPAPNQPPPAASTQAPPPVASRTLTGNAVPASTFGSMQVSIVVTGTHIDSISTIRQSNEPKSTATKLTPLALTAQAVPTASCKTTVSGATYSCEAWKQSLQSAISQI